MFESKGKLPKSKSHGTRVAESKTGLDFLGLDVKTKPFIHRISTPFSYLNFHPGDLVICDKGENPTKLENVPPDLSLL